MKEMTVISFIVGAVLGGILGVAAMCCIMINHLDERRDEDEHL